LRTKQLDQFLQKAKGHGWSVERTSKGHHRLTHPDAERSIITGVAPRDIRTIPNLRAEMKRVLRPNRPVPIPLTPVADSRIKDLETTLAAMTNRATNAEAALRQAKEAYDLERTSRELVELELNEARRPPAPRPLPRHDNVVPLTPRKDIPCASVLVPVLPEDFGIRVRSRRVSLGISQREAAGTIGVDQTLWSQWERNVRKPNLVLVPKIARALRTISRTFTAAA
jgi:DNA-binding XRE family transcriptional regulator